VKALSGGERNRLLLARLFARPFNVLVMDEPTNDLDIETLELLEELIADFSGTVLLVSHDRTFLDNIVTSTLAFEGEGRVVNRSADGGLSHENSSACGRASTALGRRHAKSRGQSWRGSPAAETWATRH
jgi:ATP-binding cassette subfamily F protein uup